MNAKSFVVVWCCLIAPHVALGFEPTYATCLAARRQAAGKYYACQSNADAHLDLTEDPDRAQARFSKCRKKYAKRWLKIQTRHANSDTPCALSRFTDNGTTITDNLTGLEWEKKTDDASVHDQDNKYFWTAGTSDADGDVFTTFLRTLNEPPACFAAQCDWRLPTLAELQMLLSESYPCSADPCVDQALEPTRSNFYWATDNLKEFPFAWGVFFNGGYVYARGKSFDYYARAVRGGF